jgi:hypothetical protein
LSTLTVAEDEDDDAVSWKLPPTSVPLTPPTWAHTVYVVPTVSPDGQANVPVKVPFVTVSFVALPTGINGVQLVAGLYPKVTDTVPLAGVMLEPFTVTVEPGAPVPGLLVIEADEDDEAEATKLPPASVKVPPPLTLLTWAHTVYVPAAVDGQLNVPMNPLLVTVRFAALPTELNGLQLVAVLYPKVTDTVVPLAGVMPEPNTVICVPAVPVPGLLVIEAAGICACAGKAAPQQSADNANANTAEHMISAMLVETIFDRFTPVFMLPSPKGPS